MTAAQIQGRDAVAAFVTAGNATFTLVSRATGARFTYRVRAPKVTRRGEPVLFVSVLTGSDNEADYSYVGQVYPQQGLGYVHGRKSRVGEQAPSVRAVRWFLGQLDRPAANLDQVEFWHEGRCCKCGRKLTVPESVATGIGPECAGRAHRGLGSSAVERHEAAVEDYEDAEARMARQEREEDERERRKVALADHDEAVLQSMAECAAAQVGWKRACDTVGVPT